MYTIRCLLFGHRPGFRRLDDEGVLTASCERCERPLTLPALADDHTLAHNHAARQAALEFLGERWLYARPQNVAERERAEAEAKREEREAVAARALVRNQRARLRVAGGNR